MKKTKIVCTLGPASRDEKVLEKMLLNGMNVARLNFSHGSHEYHKETIELFRKVRDKLQIPAAVMLDTKGPEIRLGDFENEEVTLSKGDLFTLTTKNILGNQEIVSITYKDLPSQLQMGNKILIDDGKVSLEVVSSTITELNCKVLVGGKISNHKGVNVPNVHLNFEYLSQKDKEDLKFGVENDVDYIAASFVRSKEDVKSLRNYLDYIGGKNIKIISKIENIEGVDNFDEILNSSDGIMVARGDMGVEVEYERLPGLQKKFIRKCYQAGKVVITATQMLESMIHSLTPTRAEITDVANAVFDGTSAIMLSGETAMGDHPDKVVKTMAKIARQAENDALNLRVYDGIPHDNDIDDTTNAICDAACTTARDLNAKVIIAVTQSGHTARCVSKYRPDVPIVAPTPNSKTYHQLSLSWGVYPVKALFQTNTNQLFDHAIACAKMSGYVNKNDRVVITAGENGITNILNVQIVKSR
ncbi:MAG TPA: pyruvate kinase [Acholeplasmatales bacterium]|jgi:pyruvate kinase|nr:pyruvate kinase [Bacilli bacterium]HAR58002.1 pyruvate kinase [Acholeplasmatales bacterium]